MAFDEALIHQSVDFPRPVLRFYGWDRKVSSFGYFQSYSEIRQKLPEEDLVRRPTAGGVVRHHQDWTYTLVFPREHWWYRNKAEDSYRMLHEWVQAAMQQLGLPTSLASSSNSPRPGHCFPGAQKHDLTRNGVKLAGAAQRRHRDGLLIQASIQNTPQTVQRKQWETTMLEVATRVWNVEWCPLKVNSELRNRTAELMDAKYSTPGFLENR